MNSDKIKILFFVSDGVFAPVIDSQVIVPMLQLKAYSDDIELVLVTLTSCRHKGKAASRQREDEISESLNGILYFNLMRLPAGVPFQEKLWAKKLHSVIKCLGIQKNDKLIVHCRGHKTAAAAITLKKKKLPNIRVLMDIRGDSNDEIKDKGLIKVYRNWDNERLFQKATANISALNTVSRNLADRILKKNDFPKNLKRLTIGCCVDTEKFYFDPDVRLSNREKLGLADKFVICYCGGMSHWQLPGTMAKAFSIFSDRIANAHLLIVSKQATKLVNHLKSENINTDKYSVFSASHQNVKDYLMAADLGLLLREDIITNRVASPVKFAEYLRCGVPVLTTPYVSDFGQIVKDYDIGAVIELPLDKKVVVDSILNVKEKLDLEGNTYRQKCSEIAAELFSWKEHISKLYNLYKELAK